MLPIPPSNNNNANRNKKRYYIDLILNCIELY